MDEELNACPFCGRRTYLEVKEFEDSDYVPSKFLAWVRCQNCFAQGPEKGCREAEVEAWNGRV